MGATIRYHVLSTLKEKENYVYESEGLIEGRGIINAWNNFKRYCKENKIELDKKKQYHLYQINHARIFRFEKTKFVVDSFYNNHTTKATKEKIKQQKRRRTLLNSIH